MLRCCRKTTTSKVTESWSACSLVMFLLPTLIQKRWRGTMGLRRKSGLKKVCGSSPSGIRNIIKRNNPNDMIQKKAGDRGSSAFLLDCPHALDIFLQGGYKRLSYSPSVRHRVKIVETFLTQLAGTFDIIPSHRYGSRNLVFSFPPATDTSFFHYGSQGVYSLPSRISAIRSHACPSPYCLECRSTLSQYDNHNYRDQYRNNDNLTACVIS